MPLTNKWLTFLASIPVLLSAGVTYSFAVWGDYLKTTYVLDQTQIQTIGSACNLGGFFSILAGLLYDKLERYDRLGPRLTLLVGVCANATGYLGLWAAATRRFDAAYWQLILLAFIACFGGTWFDTSCLVTNVRNFPSSRGFVVGTLKSGVGLSAAFYTALYLGLLEPQGASAPASYLLLLALAPSVAALVAAAVVNHVPFVQESELDEGQHVFTTEGRFLFTTQVILTLAVFLMTTTPALAVATSPALCYACTAGAVLLLLPLLVVLQGSGGLWARPAHPQWRDAEEGQLRPRAQQRRRRLRTGRLVPLSPGATEAPSMQEPLLGEHSHEASLGSSVASSPRQGQQGEQQLPGRASQCMVAGSAGGEHPSSAATGASARAAQGCSLQGQVALEAGRRSGAALQPAPGRHRHQGSSGSFRKERREVCEPAKPPSSPDLSPCQCLASLNFWLLFFVCCSGMGAGLVLNNNLGQLVLALGGRENGQDVFVGLFGVTNCAGRLAMGYIPERMLHASGVPRPLFLVGASCLSAGVSSLLAFARLPVLYALSMASGLAFGAHWALMPSLASELFGLHHFATNYALLQFAPAIGSIGLARSLAGYLYQRAMQHLGEQGTTCRGQACFFETFLVLGVLGVLATCCSAWLYLRTREAYYTTTFSAVHQHDQDMERAHLLLPPPSEGGAGSGGDECSRGRQGPPQ